MNKTKTPHTESLCTVSRLVVYFIHGESKRGRTPPLGRWSGIDLDSCLQQQPRELVPGSTSPRRSN